jgi:monoamine oxidase/SAM-dependent methyltransferase
MFHNVSLEPGSFPKDGSDIRVAIVGGGPGGLFSAWQLAAKAGSTCKMTIYEASDRLGGKIVTRSFPGVGLYEAGVAEIYDYSALGPDPLRELIEQDLGLAIKHIEGGPCVLDGHILPNADALAEHFGPETRDAAKAFRARCSQLLKPAAFYKSARDADNAHLWSKISGDDILEREIADGAARRYIRIMSHSDVAAPPHLTSGLNFLKNVLMDVEGYLDIYSVIGGNEEIVRCLSEEIDAEVRLNSQVRSVEPLPDGTYRLTVGSNGTAETVIADFVILALPLTALSIVDWRSPSLHHAIVDHVKYFDRPGHYLRATLLFERPFWRQHLDSAWWMFDAFDGCCVYDEGARHDLGGYGALGFLIAGNAALGLANLSDDQIEQLCIDALPPALAEGRKLLVDRRIHRWMASVNAIPGGLPVRGLVQNHRPDPTRFPGVLLVGDYMFDATLNGVLDSADAATDLISADILMRRRAGRAAAFAASGERAEPIEAARLGQEEAWRHFFDVGFVADMLRIVWRLRPGAKVLVAGSGSGASVAALRGLGFEAYGVESNRAAFARTPPELRPFNLIGDLTDLPFEDGAFDVVVEAGLCQLPRAGIGRAAAELRRVVRRGLMLGSVTSDLAVDLVERYDLLARVQTLASRWEWCELFFANKFDFALIDPTTLGEAWKRALSANSGPGQWYEDSESLLYCFYVAEEQEIAETRSVVELESYVDIPA